MSTRSRIAVVVTFASFAAGMLGGRSPARAGDWPYSAFDPAGTARSEASGAISAAQAELPGQSFSIHTDQLGLGEILLIDVSGDGVPDLITPMRGKVVAYDGAGAGLLWSTPVIRASEFVGLADLDGDGDARELLTTAKGMTGGIHVVDIDTGALRWSYGPLTDRSGVKRIEAAIMDLDHDGRDEVFFGEWLNGGDTVYLADFADGYNAVEVVQTSLPASYTNNNYCLGGDLLGSAEPGALLVQQFGNMALFQRCQGLDPAAVCAPGGQVCLCELGLFQGVHPGFSSGKFFAQDLDGDGTDEVVDILDNRRYGTLAAVLDAEQGVSSGSPTTDDLVLWLRDYGVPNPETFILDYDGELTDLTGDGDPDLVLTFYNNRSDETDMAGMLADDGIDHPDGFSVGVFDALTGELSFGLLDAIAWGLLDLDGDGLQELVVSPTSGWTYLDGMAGILLDCTPDCQAVTAWEDPTRTLRKDLPMLDGVDFPVVRLRELDADADGVPELLAYEGDQLVRLSADGVGGTVVEAAVSLDDQEDVAEVGEDEWHVLLSTKTSLRLLDANLTEVSAPLVVAGQDVAEVLTTRLDPAALRAALVVDGAVFWTVPEPTSMAQADYRTLPHVAFAQDLTGDGLVELVTWAGPDDSSTGFLLVQVVSYDPADPDGDGTPFGVLWSFDASTEAAVAGMDLREVNGHALRLADLDGDGSLELAVVGWFPATFDSGLLVLDAISGAFDGFVPLDFVSSSASAARYVPLWVTDLDDPAGSGAPDGVDDLLLADNLDLYLLPGGATAPTVEFTTGSYHLDGAFGDLDGDGTVDLCAVKNQTNTPDMTAVTVDLGFGEPWGGVVPLAGLPTYGDESMALVDADGLPGLDVALASSSGSLDLYSGASGSLVSGFPLFLSNGQSFPDFQPTSASLSAVAVYDCDGDGHEEVLVGGLDGFLYAVNVAVAEVGSPNLEWSYYVGVPLESIHVSDVDGDAADEIIVTGPESRVRVIDGIGAGIAIVEPEEGACLQTMPFPVLGTAQGVATVDVYLGGSPQAQGIAVSSGTWETSTVTAPGVGVWEIEAVGMDEDGQEVAFDSVTVLFDGDQDGDGFTLCGGDCDDLDADLNLEDEDMDGQSTCEGDCDDLDPHAYLGAEEVCDFVDNDCDGDVDEGFDQDEDTYSVCAEPVPDCDDGEATVHPGAEELCGDGVDQNCDGVDPECDPLGGDDDDDGGTGGCECDHAGSGVSPVAFAVGMLAWVVGLALRRGRRSRRRITVS